MARVPVVILGGFLGSGKTTLLLKLLEQTRQRSLSYGVLINERGEVDIDGVLVSNKFNEGNISSLLNGCICCSKKSEISESIEILLRKKPEVIFIELTGVAKPEEVANALTEKEIIAKVELKSIVTVLDALYFLDKQSDSFQETLFQQLNNADHIVINKMDLVFKSKKEKIKEDIYDHNFNAYTEFASFGEIGFEQLFEKINASSSVRQSYGDKRIDESNYTEMTTLILPVETPMNKQKVESFFSRHGDEIIRAKGFVPLQKDTGVETFVLQYSGTKKLDWNKEESTQHGIVVIGVDLDATTLQTEWIHLTGAPI